MKRLLSVLLVGLLALSLVACGDKGGKGTAGDATTLVIGETEDWWGHDVVQLDGTAFTQGLCTDPLVQLDKDGNMVPNIASAVDVSEDGMVIRLTISEGMKFSDGEELLPEDVVASLDRARTTGPMSFAFDIVESVEADGNDVVITLTSPSNNIGLTLSGSSYNILKKSEIESKSDDDLFWGCTPYGMYYLDEYVAGSHVTLKRNENYVTYCPLVDNKGAGAYETITVRTMSDNFSRVQGFNIDDIQVAMSMSADDIKQITRTDMSIEDSIIPNIVYFDINQHSPLLTDVRVRQAICLIVDRDEIIDVLQNTAYPAYSIVTDRVLGYSQDFADYYKDNYCNDVERAVELLSEAGWTDTDGDGYLDKDGQKMELRFVASTNYFDELAAQTMQIQFKEVGIHLELELYEPDYRYEVIGSGEYDLGMEYFGWSEPSMLLELLQMDESNMIDQDTYFSIVAALPTEVDLDALAQLVYDAQKVLSDECISVPLFTNYSQTAWADSVVGYQRAFGGGIIWNDIRPAA